MAFTLDNVREASYKEAQFVMDSSNITGGRKDVVHEFVNSDKQVVEDLGLKRKTYNITAIIHGNDYELNKTALLNVLEDGKKGTFIHPFDGNIEDMVARSFTMKETFTNFGVATFNIVLAPSDDIAAPTQSFTSTSEVSSQRLTVMDAISSSIESFYETSAELTGSIENSIDTATGFIDDFADATQGFEGIQSTVNSLNASIIDFNDSIASLVQTPVNLASSIHTLFTTANNAFPSAIQTLGMMVDLFDFGGDDVDQLSISTAAVNQINSNNDIINYSINSHALANAYYQFSLIQFDTVVGIERVESTLETQFDIVMESSGLPQNLRNQLTELRSITSDVIAELKTTTPELIEIEVVNEISLRKLEYLYYDDNTRTDALVSINEIQEINFVKGTLDFLNDNV